MYERVIVAIDGASRNNGKPDCVSGSGAFISYYTAAGSRMSHMHTAAETASTSQRGELIALSMSLRQLCIKYRECHLMDTTDVLIVTDSEYVFNTMTKRWYDSWAHNNWLTAAGEPVKNADLWHTIIKRYEELVDVCGIEPSFYHIKGHVIPLGKVTGANAIKGRTLMEVCHAQFIKMRPRKAAQILHAQEVSEKNNGFRLEPEIFMQFVVANMCADALATYAVDTAVQRS